MAMATRSRSLFSKPLASAFSAATRRRVSPRTLIAPVADLPALPAAAGGGAGRSFSSRPATTSLNDPSPNWSNRPPKETILLDGCDFEHWLIVMEKPEGDPTRDEIISSYIKTLAQVVGSEEEARMKLYSVSTKHYYAFGALISEELSYKMKELPRVRWVLPDSYLHVPTKDYGGEPVINGVPVPYDPRYHEEWVRNNARANERSRRNDRPRNHDRSRNFERRRENATNRDFQSPPQSPTRDFQPPPPPPFNAQNAGPGSPPHTLPNSQVPPMGGPGGGVHPPNNSMPNSGFQSQPGVMNGQTYQSGAGGPNLNQNVPPPNSGMPGSGFPSQSGGMNGPSYQGQPNTGYANQNGGNQRQDGGGYQNQGMPHGAPLNQAGGGYPNQMPSYSNQYGPGNGYQNQGMGNGPNGGYPNQGMGIGPSGGYPNQGMGNGPNGGYQNNQRNFPNQGNYQGMGPNQNQNMPGRDTPTMPTRDV